MHAHTSMPVQFEDIRHNAICVHFNLIYDVIFTEHFTQSFVRLFVCLFLTVSPLRLKCDKSEKVYFV